MCEKNVNFRLKEKKIVKNQSKTVYFLRCEAKLIYVLARSKKGKTGIERLTDLYSGPLFVVLKKIDPMYMHRICAIDGNTRELKIGLDEDIRQEIIENVNIILHAAADVRFDNTLKELSLVNLRGTREILKMAMECKRLDMFAYISTAFSHCERKFIEEKFYDVPIDPEEMIQIAEHFENREADEDVLDVITETFIHPWPNTYSFSKVCTEFAFYNFMYRCISSTENHTSRTRTHFMLF